LESLESKEFPPETLIKTSSNSQNDVPATHITLKKLVRNVNVKKTKDAVPPKRAVNNAHLYFLVLSTIRPATRLPTIPKMIVNNPTVPLYNCEPLLGFTCRHLNSHMEATADLQ